MAARRRGGGRGRAGGTAREAVADGTRFRLLAPPRRPPRAHRQPRPPRRRGGLRRPQPTAPTRTGATASESSNPERTKPHSPRRPSGTPFPRGWTNGEDLPGNFLLHRVDDTQDGFVGGSYVGIYSDLAAASLDCRETPQVGVGRTPHALARWFGSIPGIRVIKPRAVTVGGLDELLIDVSVPPTYTKICPWSEGPPVVPLIIGGGTLSSLHHVALRELSVQLIALAWRGTNVTIEVTSVHDQVPARRYLRLTQPILESLHFAT